MLLSLANRGCCGNLRIEQADWRRVCACASLLLSLPFKLKNKLWRKALISNFLSPSEDLLILNGYNRCGWAKLKLDLGFPHGRDPTNLSHLPELREWYTGNKLQGSTCSCMQNSQLTKRRKEYSSFHEKGTRYFSLKTTELDNELKQLLLLQTNYMFSNSCKVVPGLSNLRLWF